MLTKKLISKEFGEPPGWLKTMNETTGTGRKLASTIAFINQYIGQKFSPTGVDAPRTSSEIIKALEQPKIETPNIEELINDDQSFLPNTQPTNQTVASAPPVNTGIMQVASTPLSQTGLTSTEQALLSPEEQVIASRRT